MPVDFTDFDRLKTKDRPPIGTGAVTGSPPDNAGPGSPGTNSLADLGGADDLRAIEALTGTGIATRTAANTWALRTLTAPAAGLTITNPAGVAGNPTFALANDLSAIEALSGTGYAKRTGTDAWSLSANVPWADLSSTPTTLSGYGIVDAQPLDGDLTAIAALTGTNTLYYRSGASTWSAVTIGSGLSFTGGTLTSSGGGGGSPGGSTTQIQFNDAGAFGGDADFTWDKTAKTASLNRTTAGVNLVVKNATSTSYSSIRALNDLNSGSRALEMGYSGSAYSGAVLTGGFTGEAAWMASTGAFPLNIGTNNVTNLAISPAGNVYVGNVFDTAASARNFNIIGTSAGIAAIRTGSASAFLELVSRSTATSSDIAYWDIYCNSNSSSLDDLTFRSRTGTNDDVLRLTKTVVLALPTTDSSSTSTGSLRSAGGLGVIKKSFFGDQMTLAMGGAGGITVDASSGAPFSDWKLAGTRKGLIGASNTSGGLINGSASGDFCFRTPGAFIVSTDDGSNIAFGIGASGGAVAFPQLTLTTGLLINVATKSFPLTINGTTVNVLCQ